MMDDETKSSLFKAMVRPIATRRNYSSLVKTFTISPMCTECEMVFTSEEDKLSHTPSECVAYSVQES